MDTQSFNALSVFAVMPVSDLDASIAWYTKVFGRSPDNRPAPNIAEYYLSGDRNPEHGTLQLMADPSRAGGGLATINVSDIDTVKDACDAEGIAIEINTFPINAEAGITVRVGTVIDTDQNKINIIQPPQA